MNDRLRAAALAILLTLCGPVFAEGHADGDVTLPDRLDWTAPLDGVSETGEDAFVTDAPIVVQALPQADDFSLMGGPPAAPGLMDELTGRWEDLPGVDAVQGYSPSEETIAALDALHRATYEHRTRALDHRHAVFAWQHVSSQVLFGIVILIVGIGLYFSWMQFRAERGGAEAKTTTLKAGKSGIEVTSPVLGVIILALSLGFFYLYLNHVYPISEL